ncbi:LysR family transcriptional regulator [Eleftheria terrae]|uniref:LysR family transcriptional regulator n=1 Tax=Eleftheria terrae TaxID=1597781 RepID=UPI00263B5038|nr:LysR family transcriptional regulator [Eleftheria terrae]WKB53094.1 LysR family transcriptional regulator [Eleftheria terrae]
MKLTQLDGLLAFAMVARHRSFTAAASVLEVTPPAVSQAVKQLEGRLGVRLLHRTTRSVGLTEAGERYLARVGPAVSELLEASQVLDSFRDGVSGRLKVNAPLVVHEMLLRPLLPGFLAAHPAVQLELALEDGFVDIVASGFDLGIRLGASVQRDMVAVPLTRSERTCMVASPAYARQYGLPGKVDDLRDHRCIRYRFPGSGAIYRWEVKCRGQIVEVAVDGPLTVSDSLSMAQAALDGIGIAYVFERQVAPHLAAGRLLPVLPKLWPSHPGFHFYYPSRQTPATVRAFVDHCKAGVEE